MAVNGTAVAVASVGGLLLYSAVKGAGIGDTARTLLAGKGIDSINTDTGTAQSNAGLSGLLTNPLTGAAPPIDVVPGNTVPIRALNWALRQVGKPYKWGATGPNSFDCSGLVYAAYRAVGVKIPRLTTASFLLSPKFGSVPKNWNAIQVGDLVFPDAGHVVLVVDPVSRLILEAPHSGANVRETNYSEYHNIFAVRRYGGVQKAVPPL